MTHDWHLHHYSTWVLPGNSDCNKFIWIDFTPSHDSSHAWQFVIVINTKRCSSLRSSNHSNRNWHNNCKTHCRISYHKQDHTNPRRYVNHHFFRKISKIIQMKFYVCLRPNGTHRILHRKKQHAKSGQCRFQATTVTNATYES